MNLPKAIETLLVLEEHHILSHWAQSRDAIKLGIEALKGFQALRRGKGQALAELLPGETKD